MPIIRDAQMKVFESSRNSALAVKLHAHMDANYPAQVAFLPPEEVRRRIQSAIDKAREFRLTRVRTIGDFVARTFTVGPVFYEQKRIAAALAAVAADPDPDTRFGLMDLVLTDRDWQEARLLSASMGAPAQRESV